MLNIFISILLFLLQDIDSEMSDDEDRSDDEIEEGWVSETTNSII